jgi:hypothetical protein
VTSGTYMWRYLLEVLSGLGGSAGAGGSQAGYTPQPTPSFLGERRGDNRAIRGVSRGSWSGSYLISTAPNALSYNKSLILQRRLHPVSR